MYNDDNAIAFDGNLILLGTLFGVLFGIRTVWHVHITIIITINHLFSVFELAAIVNVAHLRSICRSTPLRSGQSHCSK